MLRYLRHLRRTRARGPSRDASPAGSPTRCQAGFTPRETTWLLQTADDELSDRARAFLSTLTTRSSALERVRSLALAFCAMLKTRDPNALRPKLAAAQGTELRAVAAGLARDFDAVLAALIFRWSTGPVEGHAHRLKLIKRSM